MLHSKTQPLLRSQLSSLLGRPSSLLAQATAYLNGVQPYHWFDFVNNRALYQGSNAGAISAVPGYSFSRASVGTYRNADGTTTTFTSGQLRRGDRGVLIEGARTNLFLNSATGATQNITVAATAYTLSFEGTGTVTLSGTSTAGPLVGTGALDRVSLTFTPTAGSLTLTISGTVERVNLEAGAFGSSWIPTTGTSATRAADVLTFTAGVSYPLSLWAEFERAVDTGAASRIMGIHTTASPTNNRVELFPDASTDVATAVITAGGAAQGTPTVAGALAAETIYKVAATIDTNNAILARDGTLGTADTTITLPTDPEVLRVGTDTGGSTQLFGYIRRAAIFNSALSDAQLQTVTT